MKATESNCKYWLYPTLLFTAGSVQAANDDFQDFLFRACLNAQPGSAFDVRCNQESEGGDLSGDSEDSLNPTQSLSNVTNALAETRARIKLLQEKLKEQREKNKSSIQQSDEGDSAMETFQMEGFSVLLNAESGDLERELTERERGYETDSVKFQLGGDYRLKDDWIVGAVLSIEQYDTDFDADEEGRNFFPGSTEGDSEADTVSLSFFTTKNYGQSFYIDALLSYSWSDYDFGRIGLFQESSRTLPTVDVITTASSSGEQFLLGIGAGWDHSSGPHNYQFYGRLNYSESEIDSYTENGGAGFAMRVDAQDSDETILTVGLRYAYHIGTSFGVVIPQLFAEYENLLDTDQQTTTSRFLEDTSNTPFTVTGDELDDTYGRYGASIQFVLPEGWTAFASVATVSGWDLYDQTQFNVGVRVEF